MMRPRKISALRRGMQLESPLETPDDTGGFERTWQTLATIWAEVVTVRAEGAFEASRGSITLTHRILMRWRPDVTGAMRLRDGGDIFEIVTAHDADAKRRFLLCQCRELRS